MDKFRAYRIDKNEDQIFADFCNLSIDDLTEGDVVIKVMYSTINYKDALAATGKGKILKKYPLVGGIDLSGTVISSSSDLVKEGSVVAVNSCGLSETLDGGYAEYARMPAEAVIQLPQGISPLEAMQIGTAGYTSALAIYRMEQNNQSPKNGPIIVTGATGGVGSIAVMILSKFGYKVTAVTGKKDQNDFLKKLGASNIINRKEFEGEPKLLGKGLWDGVVDTVGGTILSNVISQTKHSGIVAACGNAGGIKLNTSVMPFILRGIKLWGIDSIQVNIKRREFLWNEMINLINFEILEKYIKTVGLEELLNIFPDILKGKIAGRILVDVNK